MEASCAAVYNHLVIVLSVILASTAVYTVPSGVMLMTRVGVWNRAQGDQLNGIGERGRLRGLHHRCTRDIKVQLIDTLAATHRVSVATKSTLFETSCWRRGVCAGHSDRL